MPIDARFLVFPSPAMSSFGQSQTLLTQLRLISQSALDTSDVGAYAAQLTFQVVVAAVEVVDAQDLGGSLGNQSRQYQASRRAQVGGHDLGALELDRAAHHGEVPVDHDIRAHAHQLG